MIRNELQVLKRLFQRLEIDVSTLMELLADQRNSIPYRPRIARKLKGVTAAIFFQQVIFRWCSMDGQFYKFKEPCEHELYREGDSWVEELGFTAEEFDAARNKVAHRQTSKNDDEGFGGKMIRYKVDINRLTWYQVDEEAVEHFLREIYKREGEQGFSKTGKPGLPKPENPVYQNRKTRFTSITKNTIKDNIEKQVCDFSSPHNGKNENKRSKALATVRRIYDERIIPLFREKAGGELMDIDPQSAVALAQFVEREVDGQSMEDRAETIVGAFGRFCDNEYWQKQGLPFRGFVTQISKFTTAQSKAKPKRGPHTHGIELCDDPDCTRTDNGLYGDD